MLNKILNKDGQLEFPELNEVVPSDIEVFDMSSNENMMHLDVSLSNFGYKSSNVTIQAYPGYGWDSTFTINGNSMFI